MLRCGSYVHIPPNWLSYVAPEIMRALNIGGTDRNLASDLPFTPESDCFAFGYAFSLSLSLCKSSLDQLCIVIAHRSATYITASMQA